MGDHRRSDDIIAGIVGGSVAGSYAKELGDRMGLPSARARRRAGRGPGPAGTVLALVLGPLFGGIEGRVDEYRTARSLRRHEAQGGYRRPAPRWTPTTMASDEELEALRRAVDAKRAAGFYTQSRQR